MVVKKIRNALFLCALIGGLIVGGYKAYCVFGADIASSKIVQQLGGE